MAVRRIKLVIFIVVAAGLAVAVVTLPVVPWMIGLFESIGNLGPWAPVGLGIFYVLSCVFLLPASIPTLAAGFLFGVFEGSLTAMVGGTVGACAAFWVGRTIARDWVVEWVARSRRFTLLDNAVGEHGFKVVLLSRLSPIAPFVIINYMLGLTKVRFREYVLGTVIGVMPAMIMFVYFGAGLRSLAEVAAYAHGEGHAAPAQRVFFWIGLAVTILVMVLLTRMAQAALRQAAPKGTGETAKGP